VSRAPRKPRATAASSRPPSAAKPPEKANPERGEHEVRLGGVTYVLRPSYAAIRAIENKTGSSICQLAAYAQTGALHLDDCAISVAELIRAGAKPDDVITANVSDERIGELIYEAALPGVAAVLTICLIDAASGGRTSAGERKAVATA
jgi:hypothetical protein